MNISRLVRTSCCVGIACMLVLGLLALTSSPLSRPVGAQSRTAILDSASCEVRYNISDNWSSGFGASVSITNNTGSTIDGWTVGWSFTGNEQISSLWNASYQQHGATVTATNVHWNSNVPHGGTVEFGFVASYSGSTAPPTQFTLNGIPCGGAPPPPQATPTAAPTGVISTPTVGRIPNFGDLQ